MIGERRFCKYLIILRLSHQFHLRQHNSNFCFVLLICFPSLISLALCNYWRHSEEELGQERKVVSRRNYKTRVRYAFFPLNPNLSPEEKEEDKTQRGEKWDSVYDAYVLREWVDVLKIMSKTGWLGLGDTTWILLDLHGAPHSGWRQFCLDWW